MSFAFATAPLRAASFYVTTGTGSDEIVIDANNPYSWTFMASSTYSHFMGGVFAMKPAAGTTFGIQLVLDDPSSLSVIGTVSLTSGNFASSTAYARAIFDLPVPPLPAGDQFRVTLSLTGDPQVDTGSYTVRGTRDPIGLELTDDATTIALGIDTPTQATTTPEPAAAFILATGLLGLAAGRRVPLRAAVA